jgi:multiple sugar transport system ATP-binding protein
LAVETALGVVRVRASKDDGVAAGTSVGLSFRKERTLLYDATTERLLPGAASTLSVNGVGHG